MIVFFILMMKKREEALMKYPDAHWAQMTRVQMVEALQNELEELKSAMWREDLRGDHGILAEARDCGMIAYCICREMTRRLQGVSKSKD